MSQNLKKVIYAGEVKKIIITDDVELTLSKLGGVILTDAAKIKIEEAIFRYLLVNENVKELCKDKETYKAIENIHKLSRRTVDEIVNEISREQSIFYDLMQLSFQYEGLCIDRFLNQLHSFIKISERALETSKPNAGRPDDCQFNTLILEGSSLVERI